MADREVLTEKFKEILKPLEGRYSLAMDWGGEEISLHSNVKCEAASLIKIPILLEAYRQYQEGILSLDEWIPIPQDKKVGGAGVLSHLSSDRMLLRDLLTLMMIVSDNTATNLIIDIIGRDSVNHLCEQLGCHQTSLQRDLFDLHAIRKGLNNYTSAQDMLLFLREVTGGSLLDPENRKSVFEILRAQQVSTKLPYGVIQYGDDDPLFAHKTGENHGDEHDVGIIRHNQEEILIAVLTYDLPDNSVGRKAIAEIGKTVLAQIAK